MATPVTTPTGADPFAGAPGVGTTPTGVPPTDAPVSSGMPTFVGGAGKTTFGVPTGQNQDIGFPMGEGGQGTIPNYVDGDQWKPASDPNPDNVRELQIQLVNAGLIKLSKVHLGIWDKTSADAYAKVLAHANLSGMPASAALDQYVKSAAELPKQGLSPSDLHAMAQQVAQNTLGRDLNEAELAKFSTAFESALTTQQPTTAQGTAYLGQQTLEAQSPQLGQEAQQNSLHAVSQRALNVLSNPTVSLPAVQA